MNAAQVATFTAASGETPESLRVSLAAIVLVIALVFVAWTLVSALAAWRAGAMALDGVLWLSVRGAIVLALLTTFIR